MHSRYKYKQKSWAKNGEEKKNDRSSPRSCIPATNEAGVFPEGGLEAGQTL